MNKPLPKAKPRPATVYSSMWAPKGRQLWVFKDEQKIYFRSCGEAREWAKRHGFNGVKFQTPEGEWCE